MPSSAPLAEATPPSVITTTASQADAAALEAFYQAAYPHRPALARLWRWLYRADFLDNRIPLLMQSQGRVIAHAGAIPFTLRIDGGAHTAFWFVDFAVLPEWQRRGLGLELTRQWMRQADVYVTFCNEKSMAVFRKYGWEESFDTYLHRIYLRPFDHPRLVARLPQALRRFLNARLRSWLRLGCLLSGAGAEATIEPITEDNLRQLAAAAEETPGTVAALRDQAFWQWRLLQSPARQSCRIFRHAGLFALLRLYDGEQPASVDILWQPQPQTAAQRRQNRRLVAAIARWALDAGYACVRWYTADAALSRQLRSLPLTLVTHPRFAYFAANSRLLESLKRARWRWQLVDSDFERLT